MSEAGDAERTEAPTEKRLREAREKGQVPRSRELMSFGVIGGAALGLLAFGESIAHDAAAWLRALLTIDAGLLSGTGDMPAALARALGTAFAIVAPLIAAAAAGGFAASLALGGWNFSTQALAPDWSRIDPLKGLGRVYSLQGLVELGKALLKVVLVGGIAAALVVHALSELMGLAAEPDGVGIAHGVQLASTIFATLAGSLLLIAAVDAPYQLWQHHEQLKMTRQEVIQEYKESEGRPEVKGRIRKMQQEIARRRMMQDVPTADVVVVNPTHFAVALSYKEGRMGAPRVVAKGMDLVAQSIRELAQQHKVPIVSAPPLARALYRTVDIGGEVPSALYKAVAQVLTYVYQLRAWNQRGGRYPEPPKVEVADSPESRP